MGKISDYTRVLVSKLTDVFACDQTDNGTTETKSATVEQIGTAIGTLQNFADLDTSNKNLVDAINEIASYTPVYGNTASGSIATFDTSLALPLQDCTIDINAVQESGTPTPSSPKAISGFTGANIHVADDETPHVIDNVTAITWQDEVGTVYGGSLKIANGYTNLIDNKNYVDLGSLSWNNASGNLSSSSGIASDVKAPSANTQAFNGLCSCYAVAPRTGISDKQISVQTNGNIVISDTAIAGMTGEQVKAYVTGFILVYEVATPTEYTLASVPPIYTLNGTNNIFGDTNGDTSVVYACSLKDYIDGQ